MKTDKEIQQNVMDELAWNPQLKPAEIGVAVKDGIVTLSGQVDSYGKKIAAERAVKRVKDVKGLAEELVVKLDPSSGCTDADIAAEAVDALQWSWNVPRDSVRVRVESGWITLEGSVEWDYQRKAAARAVENLAGVTSVTNLIKIATRVKARAVKEAIQKALERSADIEASRIKVITDGRTVTLSGKARTWAERDEVESAAWKAPGVINVENGIVIA